MKRLTLLWILLFTFQVFAQQKITINFSVWDKNEIFKDKLKDSDIEIKQGKNKLQLLSLEKVTDAPLDIVLMIDTSGSQKKTLEAEKEIAVKFVENATKNKDRTAIVTFAQSVEIKEDFSSDISKLTNAIKLIELQKLGKRNTSLWNAVQVVAENLLKLTNNSKKTIILISDGVENASKTRLDEVVKCLVDLQIPVYTLEVRGDYLGTEGSLNLERISKQTGGFPFSPKNGKELQNAVSRIEQSLRHQFKVTFLSDIQKQNDKIQKVEISFDNPSFKKAKLRIVQPKGFISSNTK